MKIAFICFDDFNLGAAYVIAYLKSIGNEVRLFLENSLPSSKFLLSGFKEYVPDLVCFSCVTANFGVALQMAKNIKKYNVPTLFGGVHPSLCPDDVTNEGFKVCVGSGEEYFGGKFDPDNLYPDREIFLKQLPPVHRAYQIFMTGFGCPLKCSYCNNHLLHPKLTRRSPESCIKELKYLKERGLKYVLFDDDIFTLNRSWLVSFLNDYRDNIGLPFTCFGHAKFIDNQRCLLLKASGCQCVWLGVQSGYEDTRKEILNRQETNEEIRRACRTIKENELKLMIDHIFGLPFDTYDKLLSSYNFYKELKPDVVNCYELLYFPKAEINKFGSSKALYQKEGGLDFKRYAKSFTGIPLVYS